MICVMLCGFFIMNVMYCCWMDLYLLFIVLLLCIVCRVVWVFMCVNVFSVSCSICLIRWFMCFMVWYLLVGCFMLVSCEVIRLIFLVLLLMCFRFVMVLMVVMIRCRLLVVGECVVRMWLYFLLMDIFMLLIL